MRALRAIGLAGLLAAILSACGGFIPDQAVTDPLGLDNEQVDVFLGSDSLVATRGIAPSAVPGQADESFTFPDFELPDLPISPAELRNEISIASATLDDPAGPATITLSDAALTVRVWHGAASYDAAAAGAKAEVDVQVSGDVVLTRGTCGAASCDYTYEGDDPAFGEVSFVGGDLTNAMTVATQAPTTNNGQVILAVSAEPDSLNGSTLTITLDASSGTIGF